MARVPRHDWHGEYVPQSPPRAVPPRRWARWRFRWGRFVGWPLLLLLAIVLIRVISKALAGIDISALMPEWDLDWSDMSKANRLGLLGTGLIVIVALLRIVRDRFW